MFPVKLKEFFPAAQSHGTGWHSAVTAAIAGGLWVGHGSCGSTGASWQEITQRSDFEPVDGI